MCVLIFSTTFIWNISYSKNLAIYDQICIICLHVKYPLFVSDFNETWIFCTDFWKDFQASNLMKTRPVGAKLFHVGVL